MITADPARWEPETQAWAAFDRQAFSTAAIGRCVFLSWRDDALVGFGSFDPREAPTRVRIGHHCILPPYQHIGFGRVQFDELLRRLQTFAPHVVDAFTLDLPFFAPARRLYVAAGFTLIERSAWSKNAAVARLHYRKSIPPPTPPPFIG